jgi:hypothetical protein
LALDAIPTDVNSFQKKIEEVQARIEPFRRAGQPMPMATGVPADILARIKLE